ncbi:hypothetical protein [Streptomyces sp. NPDC127574]|uniref:hypothetical protein n=1 Tax=Streptomyces sp. NPDC127574 TaxID=3345401 RepID=UPI00363D0FF4
MDADDSRGLPPWSTTSPEQLHRVAREMFSAAVIARRELGRTPSDPNRRALAFDRLARETQAVLGPVLPDCQAIGTADQMAFVRAAIQFAGHVISHKWTEADLGGPSIPGREEEAHDGERGTAAVFDVAGRLQLPHASAEGWAAAIATDAARGDRSLEAAVKVAKYVLHPTPLALADDATRVLGEGVHGMNVRRLQELALTLRDHATATEPSRPSAAPEPAVDVPVGTEAHSLSDEQDRPSVSSPEFDDPESFRVRRIPCSPSAQWFTFSDPARSSPASELPRERPCHPRSAGPQRSGISSPHDRD